MEKTMVYESGMGRMIFKPAQDITAYELASMLQRVHSLSLTVPQGFVATWPKNMQRHWRLEKLVKAPAEAQ